MPAERAGYTVTMFLVDVSKTMGTIRTVDLPDGPNGEPRTREMTNLEWSLQFVKLKIQELIYAGRKTDQCGVVLFGSDDTDNPVTDQNSGGFESIVEYIPIGTPNAGTLAKLDELKPSATFGDAIDGIVVAATIQDQYLSKKKTWTRKLAIITDGESPLELEDWNLTTENLNDNNVQVTLVGVDFDDEEFQYTEEDKSEMKRINETFYKEFIATLDQGVFGTCAFALQEISKPDIKMTKSVMSRTMLTLGDYDTREEEAFVLLIRTSKCTAISRPASWSKYAQKPREEEDDENMVVYAPLKLTSEYYFDKTEKDEDGDAPMKEEEDDENEDPLKGLEQVEKETLVRGFKYGTTYVPCPDGEFQKLPTKSGLEICGFFNKKNFRRELTMGETQYIWGDPDQPNNQVAISSIARAMKKRKVYAIARWVTRDERPPKMGVLAPGYFEKVDCLLWAPMPFADDVRKYTFPSLDHLVNKKGEEVKVHPYLPTDEQLEAMDNFVDAMDLMSAGDKNEEGVREPWFDTRLSYNPALHRIKQAMFHSAVVNDLESNPLPPPHPEVVKYFDPPRKMLKRARDTIEECKDAFKVREVPKKVAKTKKDGHVHARDEDDDVLILDKFGPAQPRLAPQSQVKVVQASPSRNGKEKEVAEDSETEDDDEEEEELIVDKAEPGPSKRAAALPTPARSLSPELEIDRGVEQGRIIGTAYPLQDFKKNLEGKDLVTKAVEDMGYVITQIALKPFASKRTQELVECMRAMRETCLTEDEIEAWNEFLVQLKDKCTGSPGNAQFWAELGKIGREISLISESEAEKNGGESDYSESKAKKFFS